VPRGNNNLGLTCNGKTRIRHSLLETLKIQRLPFPCSGNIGFSGFSSALTCPDHPIARRRADLRWNDWRWNLPDSRRTLWALPLLPAAREQQKAYCCATG
jgi:hypothetical protein